MKLLATIRPSDVDSDAPDFDYESFRPRTAARAVLFDGEQVALIYVSGPDYYMLPGGGIDGDDIAVGLQRELAEELGCQAEITDEVGSITIYNDRWSTRQTDYCYMARKQDDAAAAKSTEFEQTEGHRIVWAANIGEAIRLVETARPEARDGKLVQARDLLFLKAAQVLGKN